MKAAALALGAALAAAACGGADGADGASGGATAPGRGLFGEGGRVGLADAGAGQVLDGGQLGDAGAGQVLDGGQLADAGADQVLDGGQLAGDAGGRPHPREGCAPGWLDCDGRPENGCEREVGCPQIPSAAVFNTRCAYCRGPSEPQCWCVEPFPMGRDCGLCSIPGN